MNINNEKEFENFITRTEREKSNKDRYIGFIHDLQYLLCSLKEKIDEEDFLLSNDIKQSVIVFLMDFDEINEIFLKNMKISFYKSIHSLEERHSDIKPKTNNIRLFMEDFYFNK